jgi:hypothetical protein
LTVSEHAQSLGWVLIEGPIYARDLRLGIGASRKERYEVFWESPRMQLCPMAVGINDRNPEWATGIIPEIPPSATFTLLTITTTMVNELVSLLITASTSYTWNWGDGFIESLGAGQIDHVYQTPGTYILGAMGDE